jgi:hypothetical protein
MENEKENNLENPYKYTHEFMLSLKDKEYTITDEFREHLRSLGILKGMVINQRNYKQRNYNNNNYKNKSKYNNKKNVDGEAKRKVKIIKPEMSEIIVVLNKFSKDTFDESLKQLTKIFKDLEIIDQENYLKFLLNNIFKNNILIELYSNLCIQFIIECNLKKLYLNYCKEIFELNKYEYFDGLTQTLVYLYNKKFINDKNFELYEIIDSFLNIIFSNKENNFNLEILKSLYNLLQIQDYKGLTVNKQNVLAFLNNKNYQDLNLIYVYIGTQLISQKNFSVKFILNSIENNNSVIANIIKTLNVDYLIWYIQLIKNSIYTNENVIDIINILLSHENNGIVIEEKNKELIEELLNYCNSKNPEYTKLDSKWKFKFMDLKDLSKRKWVKKVIQKTTKLIKET